MTRIEPAKDAPESSEFGFPRPLQPGDVVLAHPQRANASAPALSRSALFALLNATDLAPFPPIAEHFGDVRLACARDWVFKARAKDGVDTIDDAVEALGCAQDLSRRLGLWHPAKTWFAVRFDGFFWVCNAAPRMQRYHELQSVFARVRLLWGALILYCKASILHKVFLDPKIDNFGLCGASSASYYIDDEIYDRFVPHMS